MSEHESDKQPTAATEGGEEPTSRSTTEPAAEEPAKVEATYVPTEQATKAKSKTGMYVAAIVIVAVTLLTVLFMLEKEGRSATGIFDSYLANQDANTVVAVVNEEDISNSDLNTSIQQFTQAAVAQGVDTTSPEAIADIRTQALEVLVNTVLLKQAAAEQGIEVSTEDTTERLDAIQTEIGGEEALQVRIDELGLTQADLVEDIKEEIVIQTLLDTIFAEAEITVTDQEIQDLYDAADTEGADLPPLEAVSEQIESQIRDTKEQEVIEAYLETLKTDAEIEIM